jgi:hypothetical protein
MDWLDVIDKICRVMLFVNLGVLLFFGALLVRKIQAEKAFEEKYVPTLQRNDLAEWDLSSYVSHREFGHRQNH